ncbi:hypothetical protein XocBAI20_15655 [Xanthomonas oryzae pv. oryzicola]|nr:hypothetical protein XocBAI20_15655 [Xanthomonas oryzae pv. oryzicola]
MICSSEKRFFTSNLLGIGNWTPNQGATQNRGDVAFVLDCRSAHRRMIDVLQHLFVLIHRR